MRKQFSIWAAVLILDNTFLGTMSKIMNRLWCDDIETGERRFSLRGGSGKLSRWVEIDCGGTEHKLLVVWVLGCGLLLTMEMLATRLKLVPLFQDYMNRANSVEITEAILLPDELCYFVTFDCDACRDDQQDLMKKLVLDSSALGFEIALRAQLAQEPIAIMWEETEDSRIIRVQSKVMEEGSMREALVQAQANSMGLRIRSKVLMMQLEKRRMHPRLLGCNVVSLLPSGIFLPDVIRILGVLVSFLASEGGSGAADISISLFALVTLLVGIGIPSRVCLLSLQFPGTPRGGASR